jgi:hypothetical protein
MKCWEVAEQLEASQEQLSSTKLVNYFIQMVTSCCILKLQTDLKLNFAAVSKHHLTIFTIIYYIYTIYYTKMFLNLSCMLRYFLKRTNALVTTIRNQKIYTIVNWTMELVLNVMFFLFWCIKFNI